MIRRLAACILAAFMSESALADVASPALVQQLRTYDQALLDAIAPGDRQVWETRLSHDAVYVDENGSIMHREQFLAQLKPLPAPNSGQLVIVSYEVSRHGNTALVVHLDDESENYHGIPLKASYLMTETWVKERNQWKLALIHAYVVAKDPPALAIPAAQLSQYQGRYQAAADLSYDIRLEGAALVAARNQGPAQTLQSESPDVFFIAGQPRVRKIFRRDANNVVIDFVDRREGEDLVFARQAQ